MSNTQSWAETFAPINAHNREMVFRDTWGHLAPKKNITYKEKILFSVSEYAGENVSLIQTAFTGLDDSPWAYSALNEFICSFELQAGVYQIETTIRNYRFWGKPKLIYSL